MTRDLQPAAMRQRFRPKGSVLAAWLTFALLASTVANAATVTVNTNADNTTNGDGLCTLREAITAVLNAADFHDCVHGGAAWGSSDTIAFNIPGSGVHVIQPTSPLPSLVNTVIVDGYSQPGAVANTNPGTTYPNVQGLNTIIRIELDGSLLPAGSNGLTLSANNSTVRGLSIVNLLSGVAGTGGAGIMVTGSSSSIIGNFIGTHADGVTAAGNSFGVYLNFGSLGTTIGGNTASRNLIAGNAVADVHDFGAHGVSITGNLIGTDISGTLARSPLAHGIGVTEANNLTIASNVIAGHGGYGIHLVGAKYTTVASNSIGEGAGGIPLGNQLGVVIANSTTSVSATANQIYSNRIAASASSGIALLGSVANGDPGTNRFDNNVIYGNTGLGIDLRPATDAANAPSLNDPQDADSGPNGLQNFPVITAATVNGSGGVDIAFVLNSTPSTQFDISAYANSACHSSGYGQGNYPSGLQNTAVFTDASGNASGTITVPAPLPTGWNLGAAVALLATDSAASNTSEFSACAQIGGTPPSGTPPVMGVVPNQTALIGVPFLLDLSSYVTPTNGDAITGYLVTNWSIPGWATLNAGTGVISGTPTIGYAGIFKALSIAATDKDGTSNSAVFNILVGAGPNHPPAAKNDSYSTPQTQILNVNAAAGVLANDTDVDGNGLTAVLASGPAHAQSFTLNPDGSFSYTVAGNYTGPDSFTYYANDGQVNSATAATVNINVTAAPVTCYAGATSGGAATACIKGGGPSCGFTQSAFIPLVGGQNSPPAGSAPTGYSFSYDLFNFVLGGCTPGSAVTMTVTYPQPIPSNMVYWKYGPQTLGGPSVWYQLANAAINGNQMIFTLTDGLLGDDDWSANGSIVDAGGPGLPPAATSGAVSVPTLSEWGLALLSLMLAFGAYAVPFRKMIK